MPKIASQDIASRFGTYRPGEFIDEGAAGSVLEAWEAAGLIEDAPEPESEAAPAAASTKTATKPPKTSKPAKPETATKPAPERRVSTAPKAHKRFTADTTKPEKATA